MKEKILTWALAVIITALSWQVYQQSRLLKELVRLQEVQVEIDRGFMKRIQEWEEDRSITLKP